jgi:excisionase family DNA binding protein
VGRCDEVATDASGGILLDAMAPDRDTISSISARHGVPLVPEAWSVQAVADRLHVSESTVRRLIGASAFPGAFRVGRKLVRIPVTDLDAYQQQRRILRSDAA